MPATRQVLQVCFLFCAPHARLPSTCTVQARKIRVHLTKLGVAPPAGGSAAASAASLAAESGTSAPAGGAPRAASAVEPDACTAFAAADLQRYKQLSQREAELAAQQPALKLAQATAYLADVTRRCEAAQAALPPLREELQEARAKARGKPVVLRAAGWAAGRPGAGAVCKALSSELPPSLPPRPPTLPLAGQVAKYSGETFSLAKVFTTQHHMHAKLGGWLAGRLAGWGRRAGQQSASHLCPACASMWPCICTINVPFDSPLGCR